MRPRQCFAESCTKQKRAPKRPFFLYQKSGSLCLTTPHQQHAETQEASNQQHQADVAQRRNLYGVDCGNAYCGAKRVAEWPASCRCYWGADQATKEGARDCACVGNCDNIWPSDRQLNWICWRYRVANPGNHTIHCPSTTGDAESNRRRARTWPRCDVTRKRYQPLWRNRANRSRYRWRWPCRASYRGS